MDGEDIYKVIEVMGERITDLAKSYRVLNDSHHRLELELVEFRTEIETVTKIVKWLLTPSALFSAAVAVFKFLQSIGWI